MYYEEINKHMTNKFKNKETIEELDKLPNQDKLNQMADNKVYKVQFISIAVDVIDFKNMSRFTDPEIFSTIMSEFTYGVSKILKDYDARYIDVQGDAIFGTFGGDQKPDVDNAFSCMCALASFKKHLNIKISKYFPDKLKNNSISWSGVNFDFGIGAFQGWSNYISKMGQGSDRELVFMGESVNWASHLSNKAGRGNMKPILLNAAFKNNMTDKQKKSIDEGGGFTSVYDGELKAYVYGCNWVNTSYENYINNNI